MRNIAILRPNARIRDLSTAIETLKKSFGFALLCAVAVTAGAQPAAGFDWSAYSQFGGGRPTGHHTDFDVNRTRIVLERRSDRLRGHLQLELAADDLTARSPGLLPEAIFALFGDYRFARRHTVRFGQFKTPVGMDFDRPAWDLATVSRGMDAGLILHRDAGIMVSGRNLGRGFGYDVGILNPAGRSSATAHEHAQAGHSGAAALRGRYDNERWHVELSSGRSNAAGGANTADYRVVDLGVRYRRSGYNFELEWIEGSGIRGDRDRDEHVYYLHAAKSVSHNVEFVVRHYAGVSTIAGASTRLVNTHVGAQIGLFERERVRGSVQAHYVIAGGDTLDYTGLRGYRDDTLLIQVLIHARH